MEPDPLLTPLPDLPDALAVVKKRQEDQANYQAFREKMALRERILSLALPGQEGKPAIEIVRRAWRFYQWVASGDYSENA